MPSHSKEFKVPGRSADELYEKVSSDIDRFLQKTPISGYELERNAAKKCVLLKSSMVTATLQCRDGLLHFEGKLSFVALPFRSQIDQGIEKWLAKAFS